jgi:tetratricopeptide (TPR) repeat protein
MFLGNTENPTFRGEYLDKSKLDFSVDRLRHVSEYLEGIREDQIGECRIMYCIRSIWSFRSLCMTIILMGIFAGCAPPNPGLNGDYMPAVRPAMTEEEARNTLSTLLNKNRVNLRRRVEDASLPADVVPKVVGSVAYPDRLEIDLGGRGTCEIYYKSLSGKEIRIKREGWVYVIDLTDIRFSSPAIDGPKAAQNFADALYYLQQNSQMKTKNECDELYTQVQTFEETAAHYRSLEVKPSMTEEQRRYIVQANALSQQKEYAKAITQYEKALALGVTSYPAAFYNMALLAAQEGRYCAAIANMKKYLLLEPEAGDARSAQDKIYEWELKVP